MLVTMKTIPVILFAYSRPDHLRQTLDCLRENRVPLVYAFSDGPGTEDQASAVSQVREMLRAIAWCEVVLCERETNLGLGRSILTGVTEVLSNHEAAIIFEDDLICVPGTYEYLCAALERYRDDARVMSVTGWTHPRITPHDVTDQPYFDGRAECWIWGTWARAWRGMDRSAEQLMDDCAAKGLDVYSYGGDLPVMAKEELRRNIWAVRFLYWHILNHGLCLRPPWSMVEHIGFDPGGTNARAVSWVKNPLLKSCPTIPAEWPESLEHPACSGLWQEAYGGPPSPRASAISGRIKRALRTAAVGLTGSKVFDTMTPREFVELLTPPLLVKVGRRVTRALRQRRESAVPALSARPEWEYIPQGWAYAQTHPEVKGWNVQDVLRIYRQKWPQFVRMVQGTGPLGIAHESALTSNEDVYTHNAVMTFAYALGLAARDKDRLSMLDWGGGIGHYCLLAQALLPHVEIEYHCKDVSILAQYGAALLPSAHFHADDACLQRTYDFVFASTSLHYSEQWSDVLRALAAAARCLYVTGVPIVESVDSFVFVQRPYSFGYNTEYLGWCLNKREFLETATQAGMRLIREFVVGHRPFIQGAPEQNEYRGYLFTPVDGQGTSYYSGQRRDR